MTNLTLDLFPEKAKKEPVSAPPRAACKPYFSRQKEIEQAKKEHGMALAAAKHESILRVFQEIAKELGSDGKIVTIDDVRLEATRRGIEFKSAPWMGSVFSPKDWECAGYTASTHEGSHGRVIKKWIARR